MTTLVFHRFTVSRAGREVFAADEVVPDGALVVLSGQDGSDVTAVCAGIVAQLAPDRPLLALPPDTSLTGTVRLVDDVSTAPVVAAVSRDHGLLGALTATENVTLGLLTQGTPGARARRRDRESPRERGGSSPDRVQDALGAVGVPVAVRHNLAEQLSGGQQQRVAIARALVVAASVTVLDDPTSELDPASTAVVHEALAALARSGRIVVVGRSDDEPLAVGAHHRRVGAHGRHVSAEHAHD